MSNCHACPSLVRESDTGAVWCKHEDEVEDPDNCPFYYEPDDEHRIGCKCPECEADRYNQWRDEGEPIEEELTKE